MLHVQSFRESIHKNKNKLIIGEKVNKISEISCISTNGYLEKEINGIIPFTLVSYKILELFKLQNSLMRLKGKDILCSWISILDITKRAN